MSRNSKPVRFFEQADRTGDNVTYSWIIDAPKRAARHLPGWKWVHGRPGSFVTNDQRLAAETSARLCYNFVSNGTHAVCNAAPCL